MGEGGMGVAVEICYDVRGVRLTLVIAGRKG
jgi:hypothetical protein